MMLQLKKYQEESLNRLRQYIEIARFKGAKQAYDEVQHHRYDGNPFKPFQPLNGLEDVPYACLRLPTGGGKTILSAYTIRLAGEAYIENEFPLTLWLVPTNTIKSQTLETLKNPDHPNYKVLENAFNGRFRVFDITDFRQIRPQDISGSACIVVSTFASLRVDNTEGRKVYDHDENLEPHFTKPSLYSNKMEQDQAGKIKFSFVNMLYGHGPLVIVDEAHNAKSDLSIEVLKRINSACVIEYTATPAKNSNIIHSVSASELKAEEMIKLPIVFSEHVSWEAAITASIQTRQKLEEIAVKDRDYIRPIVLFQAENKDREITVEVLEKYLIENEEIDHHQIAIVTGEQRELDEINLFDPHCPIRYVITVQALKEGWDCSFAYVLCSVAKTKSATAVEQLLGRILRMPYAKTRAQADLNKAYAHVSSQSWPHALTALRDHLVGMGFEQQEAETFIYTQPSLPGINEVFLEPFQISLTSPPDLSHLDLLEQSCVHMEETPTGSFTMHVSGKIDQSLMEKLSKGITNTKDKTELLLKGKIHIAHQARNLFPAQRNEPFSIPQLCINFEDEIELAEHELFIPSVGWNLLDYYTPLSKDTFALDEKTKQYIADISEQKITIKMLHHSEQLQLDGISTDLTEVDICRWLDGRLRQQDIKQEILFEFLRCTVRDLLARGDLDIAKLVRGKFILEKILRERINNFRAQAYAQGYQTYMFGSEATVTVEPTLYCFNFDPNNYPANSFYDGHFQFEKHYYPRIGAMNSEEIECAQAIDRNPQIKVWVRNLERQPQHAFWLPTSSDKFYPDFIAKLENDQLLIIEYKGAHLNNEDSKEKELIGNVWAKKSDNLFLMVWKKDKAGRDMDAQIKLIIDHALAQSINI